jgi:Na+-translocating ferredoxin:NAD+ oxidoreductase subunit G
MKENKIHVTIIFLGVVAAIFGGALAFVNAHTRQVIEERTFNETILPTLDRVFGEYGPTNNFLKDKKEQHIGEDAMGRQLRADIYVAKTNGETVAMATIFDGRGYSGVIRVLVAVDAKTHEIIATRTLQQSETRGIGARIAVESEPFVLQFRGKRMESRLKLSTEGGDVDAMSGATITSGAFTRTVKGACDLLLKQLKEETEQ